MWLRRDIAKHFVAVVDYSISVSIEHKPSVIGIWSRPCNASSRAIRVKVEVDSSFRIREIEAVTEHVDDNGGHPTAAFGACVLTRTLWNTLRRIFVYTNISASAN